MVIIVFGLPGSGKSYFASRLALALDAVYANSDAYRLRMFSKRTYSHEEKMQVYHAMLDSMREAMTGDKSIVLDATFYQVSIRQRFEEEATGYHVPLIYIEVTAPEDLIRQRLARPRADSEADYRVYLKLKELAEPLLQEHLVLTSSDSNIDSMLRAALHHIRTSHE